jgi:8-oxo-dGTP pyrophosphatase MutT (NUDIX family)/5S rRNA maturation endonuclease (ribonuclease M5)
VAPVVGERAVVLATNGLPSQERIERLRRLVAERAVVIMTDADTAGRRIRAMLRESFPDALDVYVRRSFNGVEHAPVDYLKRRLERVGVIEAVPEPNLSWTKKVNEMAKPPSAEGITVECYTLHTRQVRTFPAEAVRFRPAAYGLWVRSGRVLLGRSRFTGQWDIPGGGVEPWEPLTSGLVREYREETGVTVSVDRLVDFRESFFAFFHNPFHSLRYFYLVHGDDDAPLRPDLEEITSLAWVRPEEIHPEDCSQDDLDLLRRIVQEAGSSCG